ncbi:MAG TPA: cytochrome c oxidase assembly protein [Solirubrobacteraceae bacterium]
MLLDGCSPDPAPWLPLVLAGGLYGVGVHRLHIRGRHWSPWRSASYYTGLLAIAAALISPLAAHDELFAVHMVQHLLLGMLGPVLLSLSAPVTLALRTLPRKSRRPLVRLLHSRVLGMLAHPLTAAFLFAAGVYLLYLTPLYAQTLRHPMLHALIHIHFLLSGCLFAWTFIGLDPVPRRGSLGMRVVLLTAALGAHAALAKLLYAGAGASLTRAIRLADLHAGAQLMYYGSDGVDLLILVAFFSRWYAAGGRRLERERRRHAPATGAGVTPA